MHIAFLLTGTNLGDRQVHLRNAEQLVSERCGQVLCRSAVFETAAWGKEDQPAFLNQALQIKTGFSPRMLLEEILSIERSMGRVRGEKYGERMIDIDILFFEDLVINEPGLHVPHPQLHRRRFALACMNDIAPEHIHPVLKATISDLLFICEDQLPIKKCRPEGH